MPAAPEAAAGRPRRARLRIAAALVGTLAGVGVSGWLMSRGMPADDASESATVATLLARIDDPDDAVRASALRLLQRDHGRSPVAIALTVDQLRPERFAGLSQPGRSGRLDFLLSSDASAWPAETRDRAARAVRRLSGDDNAAAASSSRPTLLAPAVGERLARLGRRLGG